MADEKPVPAGFEKTEGGAIVATGNASQTDPKDYDGWDWKTSKAANVGDGAMSNAERVDMGSGRAAYSDPETLRDASNAFFQAEYVLGLVGNSLREQANALAGEDGPWRG